MMHALYTYFLFCINILNVYQYESTLVDTMKFHIQKVNIFVYKSKFFEMSQNPQFILPIQAQNRFAKAAEENQKLKLLDESQNVIISDIQVSTFGKEEEQLLESINKIEEDIKNTDLNLLSAQNSLSDILTLQQQNSGNGNASEILKIVLPSFQSLILDLCKDAAEKGETDIAITTVFELEQKIIKIIDSLRQRGVYPETEEETLRTLESIQTHQQKIHDFIKELLVGTK